MSDYETYEVEKIIDCRIHEGKQEYKVRWAGFGEEDDTWEPYENLNEVCRQMITDIYGDVAVVTSQKVVKQKSHDEFETLVLSASNENESVQSDEIEDTIMTRSKTRCSKKTSGEEQKPTPKEAVARRRKKRSKMLTRKRKPASKRLQGAARVVLHRHVKVENGKIRTCDNREHFPKKLSLRETWNDVSSLKDKKEALFITDLSAEKTIGDKAEEAGSSHCTSESELNSVQQECIVKSKVDDVGQVEPGTENWLCTMKLSERSCVVPSVPVCGGDPYGSLVQDRTEFWYDEDPLCAEYPDLPVNKIVNLSFEELDMAIFMSKETTFTASLTNFQDFRLAALQGNVAAVRSSLQNRSFKRHFHLDSKFHGKTIAIEICELKCDDSHYLDDVLEEIARAGARLDAVDDVLCRTPLHFAVANGLFCRVKTLLLLRSPVNLKDKDGKTPLDLALASHSSSFNIKRTIYLLLEFGADVTEAIRKDPSNKYAQYLIDYRDKVQKLFDVAFSKITLNMSVRNTLTPLIIRGLWEFDYVGLTAEYSFNAVTNAQLHKRCLYCLVFAVFDYHLPQSWKMRLWGDCPLSEVTVNGEKVVPLQPETNAFFYSINVLNGCNKLQFRLKPEATSNKLMLVMQVVVVKVPKRFTANEP